MYLPLEILSQASVRGYKTSNANWSWLTNYIHETYSFRFYQISSESDKKFQEMGLVWISIRGI